MLMAEFILCFLTCLSGVCSHQHLMVLHSSNIRGRFEETAEDSSPCMDKKSPDRNCIGGIARTVHMIRHYRNLSSNGAHRVLYLNGGDTFHGTLWFSVNGVEIASKFVNLLQPDALVIGCKEFHSGMNVLKTYVNSIQYPIVVTNMDVMDETDLNVIKKSHVINVGSLRVGILGYLDPELTKFTYVGNLKFHDPVKSLKAESERLHIDGIHFIIAIGHASFEADQHIAANVPLLDFLIGGHSDTLLYNGKPVFEGDSKYYKGTYPKVVMQDYENEVSLLYAHSYSKYLGCLNLTFNDHGDIISTIGQSIPLTSDMPEDPDSLELLETFRPPVERAQNLIIGSTKVLLDASQCAKRECNIGNLITDAFIDCVAREKKIDKWTDTPIAFIPGGDLITIDTRYTGGNISQATILTALLSNYKISTCSLSGTDLREVIELSTMSGESATMPQGSFLQFSGIHVEIDKNKPFGSRVVSLKARCGSCATPHYKRVQPQGVYNIITYKSVIRGGAGYDILRTACSSVKHYNVTDADALAYYISKNKIIYPHIQERIKISHRNTAVNRRIVNIFYTTLVLIVLSDNCITQCYI